MRFSKLCSTMQGIILHLVTIRLLENSSKFGHQKIVAVPLTDELGGFMVEIMHPKFAEEYISNNVDPDQTIRSSLVWVSIVKDMFV